MTISKSVAGMFAALASLALGHPAAVTAASPEGYRTLAYPPAKRDNVVEDYSGVKVADPYRWLEQLDSPETRAWVAAEARLTDTCLAKIPARQAIRRGRSGWAARRTKWIESTGKVRRRR